MIENMDSMERVLIEFNLEYVRVFNDFIIIIPQTGFSFIDNYVKYFYTRPNPYFTSHSDTVIISTNTFFMAPFLKSIKNIKEKFLPDSYRSLYGAEICQEDIYEQRYIRGRDLYCFVCSGILGSDFINLANLLGKAATQNILSHVPVYQPTNSKQEEIECEVRKIINKYD